MELHLIVKIIPAPPDKGDQRGRKRGVSDHPEYSPADPSKKGGGGRWANQGVGELARYLGEQRGT